MPLKNKVKKLYLKLPFKKKLFQFIRDYIGTPGASIYQHLYFHGYFEVKLNADSQFKLMHYGYLVENEIFWKGIYGGWEKESLNIWEKLSKNASVIIDIGANTGIYSLIAKSVNPNASVYAFEPISRVFDKLVKNIELNNCDIKPYRVAVSNYKGKATIYDVPHEHQYSATMNLRTHTALTNTVAVEVETVTLSDFVELNNISAVDLIKLDVERHETEVLQGFLPHLYQLKPTILIEVIDDTIADYINRIFRGTDYLFFSINEKSGIAQEKQTYYKRSADAMNYLLCTKTTAELLMLI